MPLPMYRERKSNLCYSSYIAVLLFLLVLSGDVYAQTTQPTAQQGMVCASLYITNLGKIDSELTGRSGCEYVLQSVELININYADVAAINKKLSSIKTIDGSLIIDNVTFSGSNISNSIISFPRLTVIRGNVGKRLLYFGNDLNETRASLLIRRFQLQGSPTSVSLPELRVVRSGDIVIQASPYFAYAKLINWKAFIEDSKSQGSYVSNSFFTGTCSSRCPTDYKYCFGPGNDNCQQKPGGVSACDSQCLPTQLGQCSATGDPSACFVCKFREDVVTGECVKGCPSKTSGDPDARYSLSDTLCVDECPPGLVKFGDSCLLRCKEGTYERNGACFQCSSTIAGVCAEAVGECYPENMNVSEGILTASTVANFVNCTKIIGNLVLYRESVPYALATRYLGNITTVVGVVKVRETSYADLEFFNKLRSIEHRWGADSVGGGDSKEAALFIDNNPMLYNLGLRSLRDVRGRINIKSNPKLCVPPAEVIRSQMIAPELQSNSTASLIQLSGNKDSSLPDCACSPKCKLSPPPAYTSSSCLAPNDPTQCVSCDSYKDMLTGECLNLEQCRPPMNRYISNITARLCAPCNQECIECTGPTASQCSTCKNLRSTATGVCVSECDPLKEYKNDVSKTCEPCDKGCDMGCYGPGNLLCSTKTPTADPVIGCKPGCKLILISEANSSFTCQADECPNGFFKANNFTVPGNLQLVSPSACFTASKRSAATSSLSKASYCLPCAKNCFQCTSYSRCSRCVPGTYQQVLAFGDYQIVDDKNPTVIGQIGDFSCLDTCFPGYYAEVSGGVGYCRKCDEACQSCIGAGPQNCLKCRYRYFDDSVDTTATLSSTTTAQSLTPMSSKWRCVANCPMNLPTVLPICKNETSSSDFATSTEVAAVAQGPCVSTENDFSVHNSSMPTLNGECIAVAASATQRNQQAIIAGSVTAGLIVLIVIVVLIVVCQLRRRARDKKQTAIMMQQLEPTLEQPDGATRVDSMASSFFGAAKTKPDMVQLRLIPESALKREKMLGQGAFGTVYSGFWQPEAGVRVPVALKVLRRRGPAGFSSNVESPVSPHPSLSGGKNDRGSNGATRTPSSAGSNPIDDVINEARIMCSVSHPCCVRVVGLCLGSEDVVLVTQLVQLGSLLDLLLNERSYVEAGNTGRFGAWHLLTWASQIAEGMNYLESRGIIHRDLAARNVLVRNYSQVRITDFGLAKLLEGQQRVYRPVSGGTGERLPYKWLALESLLVRVFTHKSDVWSYGVTLWELFTFGDPPYGSNMTPDKLISQLQDGNRLPQPSIASIDAYTPMIKCWLREPEERPNFAELSENFKAMANDPGRFLAIPGDTHFREPTSTTAQPPTPNELLADLDFTTNQTYGMASGPAQGRTVELKAGESTRSKIVDAEEYLPPDELNSRQDNNQHANRPSLNSRRSRHHQSSNPQNRDSTWRNTYTMEPRSDSRNVSGILRAPSSAVRPHHFSPVPEHVLQEDYMTPTSASPANAPLLSPANTVQAIPPQLLRNSHAPSSHPQNATFWQNSGQPMSPISPTSSHRETIL